jgi:hypothetical protein
MTDPSRAQSRDNEGQHRPQAHSSLRLEGTGPERSNEDKTKRHIVPMSHISTRVPPEHG